MTEIGTRDDSDRMMKVGARMHPSGQQYPVYFRTSKWTFGTFRDRIRAMLAR